MPFVPVPNTIAIDAIYLLDSQRVENTLYFEKPDGWTIGEITDFVTALRALIQEELLPLLTAGISLVEILARLLDTASSIGFSLPGTPGNGGGVGGGAAPNNATFTVSFKTGLTGRSFRGRNYVPGIPDDARVGNIIDADFITGLKVFYGDVRALASEHEAVWVVVSRFSGVDSDGKPIPRTTGVTTPILSVTTFDNVIDSQRRRLPGRGA